VQSCHLDEVINTIQEAKTSLHLTGEAKWIKVSTSYLGKYKSLMSIFFKLMAQDKVRTRIMFRSNMHVPVGLTKEQVESEFFRLYYQFVKHSFGLSMAPISEKRTTLRIYFDRLPDKHEKAARFKNYIHGGVNAHINYRNIFLPKDNISEVVSHEHVVLQCVDIITGAMSFKLNRKHSEKMPGKRTRGNKTIAKEELYKHINAEIRKLYGGYAFNVGVNTGQYYGGDSRWSMPYRHWLFIPRNHIVDTTR